MKFSWNDWVKRATVGPQPPVFSVVAPIVEIVKAQGRHRHTMLQDVDSGAIFSHTYDEGASRRAKTIVTKFLAQAASHDLPWPGPVSTQQLTIFPHTDKFREGFYHMTKPDIDNLAKLVWDASSGVLWEDDDQIQYAEIGKRYELRKGSPGGTLLVVHFYAENTDQQNLRLKALMKKTLEDPRAKRKRRFRVYRREDS